MRNEIAGKRLIRVPEVLRRVGFSRTTMYELIKEGRFPDKVIIGARYTALLNAEMAGYPISCVGWVLAGFVYGVQHDPQDILAGMQVASCC